MELLIIQTLFTIILLLVRESGGTILTTNPDVQTFEKYDYGSPMSMARVIIDQNNEVKQNGVMFAVTAYFMTAGPVEFSLWMETADAGAFELKYKYKLTVDSSMLFKRQEFYLPPGQCVRVYPGYKIGIILPANSMPIGYRFSSTSVTAIQGKTNEIVGVGDVVQMDNLMLPYIFAVAANYDTKLVGIDPNDTSIKTMNCPTGAKVLPDTSVLTKCNTSATALLQECPVNITYIPGPMGPPGLQGPPGPPSLASVSSEALVVNSNIIGILIWLSILTLIQFIVIVYLLCRKKKKVPTATLR